MMTGFLILSFAIMVVQLVDVGYTCWAIKHYKVSEGNPIWKWVSKSPVWFVMLSTLFHALILIALWRSRAPIWQLVFILIVRSSVVLYNSVLIRRRKSVSNDEEN
jgi:hypothetical protein